MSEYQYYEWQTADRLLTADEQQAVNSLSSHIEVSSSQAVVTYSWGDFKHNPRQVLIRFFDAHLYRANWGSRRLMFRFPAGLLSASLIASFCVREHIAFNRTAANRSGRSWTTLPGAEAVRGTLRYPRVPDRGGNRNQFASGGIRGD